MHMITPSGSSLNRSVFDIAQGEGSNNDTAVSSRSATYATALHEWAHSFVESNLYQNWTRPVLKKFAKYCVAGGSVAITVGLYEANRNTGIHTARAKLSGNGSFSVSEITPVKDRHGLGANAILGGGVMFTIGLVAYCIAERTKQRARDFVDHENSV